MRAEDRFDQSRLAEAQVGGSLSLSEKLHRAAYVVGGGVKDGLGECWTELKEHPMRSALTVAGAAGVGGALALAQRSAGVLALGGEIAGLSFGFGLAKDVIGRSDTTWKAVSSSFDANSDLAANRRVVAGTVGPFALDMGLATLGGAIGAGSVKAGSLISESRASRAMATSDALAVPTSSETLPPPPIGSKPADIPAPGKIPPPGSLRIYDLGSIDSAASREAREMFWSTWPGVFQVQAKGARGGTGTGFFLTETGEAITNFHVVANANKINIVTADGSTFHAAVTEVNPRADLALLKVMQQISVEVPKKVKFEPLPLAERGVPASSDLYSFGHNHEHQGLTLAVGRFSQQVDGRFPITRMPAPLDPAQPVMETQMLTKPGFSGGPVVNERGEVVAVNFASNVNGLSYAIPLSSVRDLIRTRQQRFGGVQYSVDSVPLLPDSPGGRTEFTTEFSDLYSNMRPSIFKIGGMAESKPPFAGTALAVGQKGYFITSAEGLRDLKWIALNHRGLWQLPLQIEAEHGGLALLRAPHSVGAPDMVPYITRPSNLSPGQRLIAMGYPSDSLEVHTSIGSFRGAERSNISSEAGLAGSPVVTKSGSIVGILRGNSTNSPQIIPLDQRNPLLQKLS